MSYQGRKPNLIIQESCDHINGAQINNILKPFSKLKETRCVYETQMPPYVANSKGGHALLSYSEVKVARSK
jgi:hypothetical protein